MSDIITSVVQETTRTWRTEAEERRRISRTDPVADALDYCAGEIAARVRDALAASAEVSVEQYADAEGVTPQTVRTWIRKGVLPARETARGYRIRKDAQRQAKSA